MATDEIKNMEKTNVDTVHDDVGSDTQHRCGWNKCTPRCLQKLHNVYLLCTTMCVIVTIQGMIVNGLIGTSVTSLQKRFNLTSTHLGILVGMYDVALILVLLPITYIGGKSHKGKWITAGVLFVGLGSLVFSLPQFVSDEYQYSHLSDRKPLCQPDTNLTDPCEKDNDVGKNMFYVFLLAQILNGIGCSPLFTLTYVYLDENSSRANSSLLNGIYYSMSIAGVAFGFLAGSFFLNIYGDFYRVDEVVLDTDDENWYGAWWIGFVLCFFLCIIIAIPMSMFAKELPSAETYRKENLADENVHNITKVCMKEFKKYIKSLLTTPTYVLLVLADGTDGFLLSALASFLPLVIEKQFGVTASQASLYAGIVIVPGGLGTLVSGIILKKTKMSTVAIIRFGALMFLLGLAFILTLFMHCDLPPIVGENEFKLTSSSLSVLNITSCSDPCHCFKSMYDPVCDPSEEFRFFSPCHAGCTSEIHLSSGKVEYGDCTCLTTANLTYSPSATTSLKCQTECNKLVPFLVMLFLAVFFTLMAAPANLQGILRCVAHEERSLATGLGWVIGIICGNIPGPVVIGVIIDVACITWSEDCGKGTSCLLYDNKQMRTNIVIVAVTIRIVSTVLMFASSFFFKPPKGSIEWGEQNEISESVANVDMVSVSNTSTKMF